MPAAPGGGAGAPGGHQPPFRVLARDPPAARGTPAAHRPTPRRGRRNGNLRWELCGAPRSRRPGRVRGQLHEDEARAPLAGPQNPPSRSAGATEDPGAAASGGVERARHSHRAGPACVLPEGSRGATCGTFSAPRTCSRARVGAALPGGGRGFSPPRGIPGGKSGEGGGRGRRSLAHSLYPQARNGGSHHWALLSHSLTQQASY